MSDFIREDRYIAIKRKDMEKSSAPAFKAFTAGFRSLHDSMLKNGAPARSFLVIESDWPEFEPAYQMIEARMCGRPNELDSIRGRLNAAEQFVQKMVDCTKGQDSIATGYLSDILDVIKGGS